MNDSRVQASAMKTFKFLFLVTIFVLAKSEIDEHAELAIQAIQGVLQGHFAPNEPRVVLFFYGPNSAVMTGRLMQKMPPEVSVQVIRFDTVKGGQVHFKAPSVILCDSGPHYFDIAKFTESNRKGLWPNILIYAPRNVEATMYERDGNTTKQVKRAFDVLDYYAKNNFELKNVNFINVTSKTTVDLVTNFYYSPGKCNSPQYRTINRFSADNMKWQTEEFFPDKYKNLFGCKITAVYIEHEILTNEGLYGVLARNLNFQMERIQTQNVLLQFVMDQFDIMDLKGMQSIYNWHLFEFSAPIYSDSLTFTVPVGEPYTQLEKMFLMFDRGTWICIGVTLAVSVLAILIINFMSASVQDFVFGRKIRTAMLNLASIFLTGGQHRVPGRNFARYMLTMFVIWSLIIRTCYQSELYKNLQTDMRKPRIQSIDELNEKNFTLMYLEGQEDLFEEIAIKRFKLTQIVSSWTHGQIFMDFENKMTSMLLRKQEKMYSPVNVANFSPFHLLSEDSATVPVSLMFSRNHRLSKTFIKVIDRLIPSGVPQKLDIILQANDKIPQKDEDPQPQILTVDHLSVCFAAILICLGLSCIVFIVECISKHL